MISLSFEQYRQLSPKEQALHNNLYWEQSMNPRRLAFLAALLKMSIREGRIDRDAPRLSNYRQRMYTFDLRPVENGFELRGGQLPKPMVFRDSEPRPAVHLVGFLSQKLGSELRSFNAAGQMIETRRYEPIVPMRGAVGGLQGPTEMT